MRYLEPNQLESNQIYFCVLYDGTYKYLRYINGYFEDKECTYTFDGDIRYVFYSINDYVFCSAYTDNRGPGDSLAITYHN